MTASKIARIIEFLEDGKWHSLKEILEKTKLREYEILQVIAFLMEYDLVMVNGREEKVKLRKVVQRFLAQTTP